MDERIANPKVLGFLTLAVAGWTYSMSMVGWYHGLGQVALGQAAVLAMIGLLIAAIASFMRGETWYAVFFMFWSVVFWSQHSAFGAGGTAVASFEAWFWLTLAAATCVLWLGALRAKLPMPTMLFALFLTIAVLGYALGIGIAHFFFLIGGYAGLVASLLAFWAALSELPAASAPAPSASAM